MLGASDRYQSNPSLHTSSPVLKSAPHTAADSDPPVLSVHPHLRRFIHTQEGENRWSTGDQTLIFSHRIMNQWVFVDCETRLMEKDGAPRKHDFTNLLHPTLQTKSSFVSFCTKSGKYYDRIDYIYMYTHTLHAKYCKHSSFFVFDFDFFYFLLPETVHILFYF